MRRPSSRPPIRPGRGIPWEKAASMPAKASIQLTGLEALLRAVGNSFGGGGYGAASPAVGAGRAANREEVSPGEDRQPNRQPAQPAQPPGPQTEKEREEKESYV